MPKKGARRTVTWHHLLDLTYFILKIIWCSHGTKPARLGDISLGIGGIFVKWDENLPYERVIPRDRYGNILPI